MQLRLWDMATGEERTHFTDIEGDVFALAIAPGDRILASTNGDGSILLWDVTGGIAVERPSKGEWEKARTDLFGKDAGKAYQALWTLASASRRTMPWLKTQVKPAVGMEQGKIDGLIRQLDDDNFVVREAATRDLAKVAEAAEPSLRKALEGKPSAEMRQRIKRLLGPFEGPLPSPERVRQLRILELLEQIGMQESKELLATLAAGAPGVFLTREAKASLRRLDHQRSSLSRDR